MDAGEILRELIRAKGLPREEIAAAAAERRAEKAPLLFEENQ